LVAKAVGAQEKKMKKNAMKFNLNKPIVHAEYFDGSLEVAKAANSQAFSSFIVLY
jgi:hypothetical protein